MDPYRELFREYVADLTAAKDHAETWWAALLEAEAQRLGDRASAEETLNQRWPLGPTSHPRVVAVYRKYYRACSAISNALDAVAAARDEHEDEIEEDDDPFSTVSTGTFLIDYLCDESDALGEFLLHKWCSFRSKHMPYSPIGRDADGNWV